MTRRADYTMFHEPYKTASAGKMKFCLLGATFATDNMGVGALTAGAIDTVLHMFPDAEIYLLDYGKNRESYRYDFGGRPVPIGLINLRFSKKFYLKNNIAYLVLLSWLIRLVPFRSLREKICSCNEYLNQIAQMDVFASIAGGDSFSDIYGLPRLFYVSLPQFLVLSMGRTLFLLPQTIGPFKGRVAKFIARFILKRAKLIYSRDHEGFKEIRVLMGKSNIAGKLKFCYDVGFVMSPKEPQKTVPEEIGEWRQSACPVVGLNVSGLLFMGGYTRDNMFGLKVDYHDVLKDIIRLIMDKGACVLLVPHVFGDGGESDAVACGKIYDEAKPVYKERISLVRGSYNQNEIKYVIGQCDLFIGARMHACIAALSQNIPAVSIAYSKKFRGVMQTIGMDALVVDPRTMDRAEILRIVASSFENRSFLGGQLARKMPEVKKAVRSMMGQIYLRDEKANLKNH